VGDAAARTGPAGDPPGDPPGDAPGYERARAELAEVVARLEAGGLSLEESLALWERGERLADACQAWLDGARQRLDAALRGGEPPDPD